MHKIHALFLVFGLCGYDSQLLMETTKLTGQEETAFITVVRCLS